MNQNDINRTFTEKVTELLSRGYQIHPGTMGGSQGEIAHVDLYRGDEIIRVLLDHSAGRGEKPDGVRLIVGRNTDRIRMNCFDLDAFIALTKKYVDVTELTQTIVNEYIKKIIIHAPDKSGGKRRQKVEIIFNFVDEVEIPVLAEPMIAESTLGRRKTA